MKRIYAGVYQETSDLASQTKIRFILRFVVITPFENKTVVSLEFTSLIIRHLLSLS